MLNLGTNSLIKSIYWEQTNHKMLVYQFPFKDITLGSVLTVAESQEALFYKDGALCDKFTAGRYVLSTENIPLLNRIINLPSEGDSTFKATIWFVDKVDHRRLGWYINDLRVVDSYFQIPLKMTAHGQYGIRVKDSALLMQRLVGTNFTFTVNDVQECFNKEVQETTGALIARFFREENVNVNELGSEYKRVASLIGTQLAKVFSSYGLELTNFNVAKMGFDENDENYKKVMDSIAERARLSQLGVTYTQQKQFDIAEAMANNKGAGTMMGVGMGIGLGQQMGQIMGQMMGNVMSPQTSASASSFYVAVNGQSKGPYTLDVIRGMIGRGEVLPTTYVFKMGGLDWIYAQEEPELAANFRSMTPPPPPAY